MQAKKNVMRLKLGSTNQLGTAAGGTGGSSCLSMTSKPMIPEPRLDTMSLFRSQYFWFCDYETSLLRK